MRLAFTIIIAISLLATILFITTIDSGTRGKISMPWHIHVIDDQHVEVFDITLNQTTLEQARIRFGQLEGMALYQDKGGEFSLEAYFGKVTIGPIDARIIANLDATQTELGDMAYSAINRTITKQGSQKWTLLDDVKRAQSLRMIKSLTYIPGYSGLDEAFIKQRFGEPASREKIDDTTEVWLYPDKGVRIILDSEGREVFEYLVPADFNS